MQKKKLLICKFILDNLSFLLSYFSNANLWSLKFLEVMELIISPPNPKIAVSTLNKDILFRVKETRDTITRLIIPVMKDYM